MPGEGLYPGAIHNAERHLVVIGGGIERQSSGEHGLVSSLLGGRES